MPNRAIVNFYIAGQKKQFARRTMFYVPRVGETCIFNDIPYPVKRVEWCLDEGATPIGVRVNIELEGQ